MISFDYVSKYYANIAAIQDVTLFINPGELFGLIGPDGAGKTTLFRMLTTLILPDVGTIKLNGRDVVKDYRFIRNQVGYMPGTFSLYPDLTVEENLHFFASIYGTTVKENYQLVRDIYQQIEPYKTRKAKDLSGGMKQKLALSCALIHRPMVLVLDEPTTGVDAVSRKEFWQMLKRLKTDGLTILVSTAYMDEATLCDRVALIQHGWILDIDMPKKILDKFQWNLVAVHSSNTYHALTILRNSGKFRMVQPFGDSVHVSLSGKTEETILHDCLKKELKEEYRVEKINPGIEDCFMDLMMTS